MFFQVQFRVKPNSHFHIKGRRIDVLKEMVRMKVGVASEIMSDRNTILHLYEKNNSLDSSKVLMRSFW